jgi:hypothetical protein
MNWNDVPIHPSLNSYVASATPNNLVEISGVSAILDENFSGMEAG